MAVRKVVFEIEYEDFDAVYDVEARLYHIGVTISTALNAELEGYRTLTMFTEKKVVW